MKEEKIDWEKNHGKILHEYTLYDFIKNLAEVFATNRNNQSILFDSVEFNLDEYKIKLKYVDKYGRDRNEEILIPKIFDNNQEKCNYIKFDSDGFDDDDNEILGKIILFNENPRGETVYNIDKTVEKYLKKFFIYNGEDYLNEVYDGIKKYVLNMLKEDREVKQLIKEIIRG
ncbi:MAG: hypothetical protein J6574_03910 [Gilliamella sp.]|nr:hypothetical protein [Gilliamella sp.]